MKIEYFRDTDTLYIEFVEAAVSETRDLDENVTIDLDQKGQICAITVEHPGEHAISTSRVISEIRRISGLTWDELGKLFQVSRRSVHFWASGQPMGSANVKFLLEVLVFFRKVDRGSARNNRVAVFQTLHDRIPFDLISEKKFTEAEQLIGRGIGREKLPSSRMDPAEKVLRSPLPPERLVDAMSDRIHLPFGKGRAVQTSRIKHG